MVESPRLCYDDVSQEPVRLLTGIADTMAAMSSWNMHVRSDMVVVIGPEQATLCERSGWPRARVHEWLVANAGMQVAQMRRGGNWRDERARRIGVDPSDDAAFVPVIKDPRDLHLMVAGGWGPVSAVAHGWGGGSRAVHGTYRTD